MKLHGYKDEGLPTEQINPVELAEVTLVATPSELRKIAAFLEAAAKSMESMGRSYSHEHLADKDRSFTTSPHLVVASVQ
jgi:hypothetical protein